MVFRDVSVLLGLPASSVALLVGVLFVLLFLSSFVMFVIVKLLQREDVLGVFRGGGKYGFFRVFDTRLVLWVLYGFVSALDVSLADLAWMYAVVILVALLAYEFLFDLGALKTSIAFVFDFVLTLLSVGVMYLVFLFVTGAFDVASFKLF